MLIIILRGQGKKIGIIIVQAKIGDGGLDQHGNSGVDEKWLDF